MSDLEINRDVFISNHQDELDITKTKEELYEDAKKLARKYREERR